MDIDLGRPAQLHYDVLDFLGGDVLALLQLEYILFPVYNFETAVWQQHPDVSSVEPALAVNELLGALLVLEVAGDDRAPHADFAPGHELSLLVRVSAFVVHFRNVLEHELGRDCHLTDHSGQPGYLRGQE